MNTLLLLFALSAWPPGLEAVLIQEPTPSKAKAVITDQFGSPHVIRRESNQGMIVFSGKKSVCDTDVDSIKWTILPLEYDTRKYQPNPLEFAIGLEGQDVTLTVFLSVASGKTVDHVVQTIICGKGGVPPPKPLPPDPEPPKPTPVVKSLRLVVVEDQFNRTEKTSATLNDRKFWDGLVARGHSFSIVPENSPSDFGKALATIAKTDMKVTKFPVGAAYLIFTDANTRGVLASTVDLPSVPEIEVLITKYTGVK